MDNQPINPTRIYLIGDVYPEANYTIGAFISLDDAMDAIFKLQSPLDIDSPHWYNDFDVITLEVYELKFGWGSQFNKVAAVKFTQSAEGQMTKEIYE